MVSVKENSPDRANWAPDTSNDKPLLIVR